MKTYKKIIPDFLDNIYDINKNKNYYLLFTKEMYIFILYLKYNYINKWSKYNNLTTISNNDNYMILSYNKKISYISSYNCKNNIYPFKFIINKNEIIAKLITYTSLNLKIINRRYTSFLIQIRTNNNIDHILNLIFDNYKYECYIIECEGIIYKKIHKIMEYYGSNIGYKYIILENLGIILNINDKIKSIKQKHFFIGYCMGWCLFFKYIAENADINFEMKDYLKTLSLYKNKGPLFEFIEIFQVWFYKYFF